MAQEAEKATHGLLIVRSFTYLGIEIGLIFGLGQLGQKTVVSTTGTFRISETVVCYRQQPRKNGIFVHAYVLAFSPCL